jgi:hypothetical protein
MDILEKGTLIHGIKNGGPDLLGKILDQGILPLSMQDSRDLT